MTLYIRFSFYILSNIVLNVNITISAKYGCVLVCIYVMIFSAKYFSNISLFLIPVFTISVYNIRCFDPYCLYTL
ncbi:MAG: hypothetical protein ACKPKO_43365 [Candidatus Fonsibacter sp.]